MFLQLLHLQLLQGIQNKMLILRLGCLLLVVIQTILARSVIKDPQDLRSVIKDPQDLRSASLRI